MIGNQFTKSPITKPSIAERIAFVHHKGGTGKTTACLNIAGWLTKLRHRVLVVDLDPQANATTGLGVELSSIDSSMYEVMLGHTTLPDIILETLSGIYLAPASIDLLLIEKKLSQGRNTIHILQNKLNNIAAYFDYILIDSPPGSTLLMMNSIAASGQLIVPLDSGIFSFETLSTLKTLLTHLEDEFKVSTKVIMALLKAFSPSILTQGFTKEIHNLVLQSFENINRHTIHTVPFSQKICEAQMKGLPISHFAPYSKVGKKYKKITKAILKYFIADLRRSDG